MTPESEWNRSRNPFAHPDALHLASIEFLRAQRQDDALAAYHRRMEQAYSRSRRRRNESLKWLDQYLGPVRRP
jgi:hypothetical protein